MITFATQEDFENAVMDVLRERLDVDVSVSTTHSDDYYSSEKVPQVEVRLLDALRVYEPITSAQGKAY